MGLKLYNPEQMSRTAAISREDTKDTGKTDKGLINIFFLTNIRVFCTELIADQSFWLVCL